MLEPYMLGGSNRRLFFVTFKAFRDVAKAVFTQGMLDNDWREKLHHLRSCILQLHSQFGMSITPKIHILITHVEQWVDILVIPLERRENSREKQFITFGSSCCKPSVSQKWRRVQLLSKSFLKHSWFSMQIMCKIFLSQWFWGLHMIIIVCKNELWMFFRNCFKWNCYNCNWFQMNTIILYELQTLRGIWPLLLSL